MRRLLERLSLPWEVFFAALATMGAVPLWIVRHPPIQDLTQHLAAIRVLTDYSDAQLGFERFFELSLGSTQYLAYYLAARVLAVPFGVITANTMLVSASIIGTPYAMRALLRALGRDERLALFVLPLIWNAHLILGFLNFVAAIPLCLWGLAVAVQLRQRFSRGRAVGLAVIAVVTFYTHVVPFGFLGLGAALVAVGDGVRPTLRRWLPLVPSALAAILWSRTSPAGQSTLTAAFLADGGAGPQPQFMGVLEALRELPAWLTDVLHSETDEKLLVAWGLLLLASIAFGVGPRDRDGRDARLGRRLGLLAPLAGLAYFVAPASYDWIWPINTRFPLLALLFLVPVLPAPRRATGVLIFGAVALVAVLGFVEIAQTFREFEADEVGALDEAIEVIPPGSRVAGLIWDRGSRLVKFSPFIHSVAWYQAERGGAVMFTFADFPHSPFRFREGDRPPRVVPRWEWMPEHVDPRRDLAWYDYVLVRGGPGRIAAERDVYEPLFRDEHWSVWRRIGSDR